MNSMQTNCRMNAYIDPGPSNVSHFDPFRIILCVSTMISHSVMRGSTPKILTPWPRTRTIISKTSVGFIGCFILPINLSSCGERNSCFATSLCSLKLSLQVTYLKRLQSWLEPEYQEVHQDQLPEGEPSTPGLRSIVLLRLHLQHPLKKFQQRSSPCSQRAINPISHYFRYLL